MAVSNSLVRKQERPEMVTYEANGEMVRLEPETVKRYLVSGGGNVTDQEIVMFLNLCKYQHLNPFLRDAYLIKYGDNNPASMVVGKDVYLKRAQKEPQFRGYSAGVIVRKSEKGEDGKWHTSGEPVEREGSICFAGECLVGGWAKVYLKDYVVPVYAAVKFEEYAGKKKDGSLNTQWSKMPGTMIRKVALAQALREAFPDKLSGGMYQQEEIAEVSDVQLDETPVPVQEVVVAAKEIEAQPDMMEIDVDDGDESVKAALFD